MHLKQRMLLIVAAIPVLKDRSPQTTGRETSLNTVLNRNVVHFGHGHGRVTMKAKLFYKQHP
jgi:hypothetical protein